MKILFHYESLAIGGQQTQTLCILEEIYKRNLDELYFIYHYDDDLAKEYTRYCTLLKIPVVLKSKDYVFKPWKILKITYLIIKFLKKHKIEIIVSGSGLGSLICGIASRICKIGHYRIIGCSLAQVEKTLYKYYSIFKIDKLIDGYFGWNEVFNELRVKGVKEGKFIYTVLAVNTSFFCPLTPIEIYQLKRKYKLPDGKIIIGWVGRISYDMQIKYTIEMCRLLLQQGFDKFHLLIVGGGSWFKKMKEKLDEYNLTDKATLTNWVRPNEVNSLLNCMDVVPLLEEDPQGGSIVREAMACGKIALSVNGKSGMQASFMKGDTSILVEREKFLENAAVEIIMLYNNPTLIKEKGINARLYAQNKLSFTSLVDTILFTLYKDKIA